jgi:hypothetical protein
VGKRPRVVFTARAGQMAGNAGHVVELSDPTGSDEWIVVRFGRDELPFSPADLAVVGRQPTGRPAEQTLGRTAAARVTPVQTNATRAAPAPTRPATAFREEIMVPARRTTAVVTAAEPVPAPAAAKAPKQPRPPKTPAPLVVTLSYADRRWTVAAQHGSKSLVKPYPIAPTEALRMLALIEVPGVHDAVANIMAAERAEAEQRAQRLRAELAEIESRLAELSSRS